MMTSIKKRELLGILGYFLIASLFIVTLQLGYLAGTMIYLVAPSIYITIKKASVFRKTALFSALLSAPLVLVFNYIATVSGAWFEVTSSGIRVLGTFPIETFLWAFSVTYFTIVFYEYFFDRNKEVRRFPKSIKYLVLTLLLFVTLFGLVLVMNRDLLVIEYFYTYFAFGLFIVPPVFVAFHYPVLLQKMVYQGLYFLLLSLIYEMAALQAGHWYFPGSYIGFVEIFGYRFPFEEFIWLAFCVPSTIAIYEVFADDRE